MELLVEQATLIFEKLPAQAALCCLIADVLAHAINRSLTPLMGLAVALCSVEIGLGHACALLRVRQPLPVSIVCFLDKLAERGAGAVRDAVDVPDLDVPGQEVVNMITYPLRGRFHGLSDLF